jgi:ABC-type nitrate/sulfonate/bicarbonate transport system substrate-binding protein
MRPLQCLLCFLFCTGIFIVFGLGMQQLAAEGHVPTEFASAAAQPDPTPPPHIIVAGAFVDRHAGEAVALAERLAEADKALQAPGGTRQQIQDAQAEYYNDLCMLHLLAARSPQTDIPGAAQSRMRDTPMEQACGEP